MALPFRMEQVLPFTRHEQNQLRQVLVMIEGARTPPFVSFIHTNNEGIETKMLHIITAIQNEMNRAQCER